MTALLAYVGIRHHKMAAPTPISVRISLPAQRCILVCGLLPEPWGLCDYSAVETQPRGRLINTTRIDKHIRIQPPQRKHQTPVKRSNWLCAGGIKYFQIGRASCREGVDS